MKLTRYLALPVAVLAAACGLLLSGCHPGVDENYEKEDFPSKPVMESAPKSQDQKDADKKSTGCLTCHTGIENPSMHASAQKLGCTDCHGGKADKGLTNPNAKKGDAEYTLAKEYAHIQPRGHWYGSGTTTSEPRQPINTPLEATKSSHAEGHAEAHGEGDHGTVHGVHGTHSANPKRPYQVWMMESAEFVRFVNPGDLRVAKYSCGACHDTQTRFVPTSMMATGAMLWNAALYNNGGHNQKVAHFGEGYTYDGKPARIQPVVKPSPEATKFRGELPYLDPLPRYNVSQPGNILRVFERGGRLKIETAQADKDNDPGKPESKLSIRGIGTNLSTDPVYLGLQKTRLLDPMLWQMGTNDQAGDYRASGCSACHVMYANDRDKTHSGPYAKYGKDGQSFTKDKALADIVGKENGHPIKHVFTKAIPSSQCIVCHMHPGTTVTMTYYGNLWWDNETGGDKMYPKKQIPKKTEAEELKIKIRNVEGSALRGLWGNTDFLQSLTERNKDFKNIQFADYSGHGWVFRNIYKQDRHGNLLDKDDKPVPYDSPDKFKKGPDGEPIAGSAVHMQDIHLEKGMHCTDCHFSSDAHGNGNIYGEVRNATEIMCIDCHGTIYKKANLATSGNAAPKVGDEKLKGLEDGSLNIAKDGGTDLSKTKVFGEPRFKWKGGKLFQHSAVDPDKEWEVVQTMDTITPGNSHYSEKSRLAKTMRKDAKTWGDVPTDPKLLAHQDEKMDCYTCHTSWMASCFGCHLPMKANQARVNNHYEGAMSRNWTQYNFQTLREDCFMLGVDGTVKKNKIAPVRSTCAVLVGSQNAQRENLYSQQQTISAEGFSGQAFSPHYPHSVRSKETKGCTDCHVSKEGDNNAWMAQLMLLGTNQTNFIGKYVYVASGKGGVHAVVQTETEEPQAVYGSTLHRDAYPERYAEFVKNGRKLEEEYEHVGETLGLQMRGEYLYAARGKDGLVIFDIANIDNKGFSERINTAPVSPVGQNFTVSSKYCTSVISPTVLGVDPTRQPPLRPRDPQNQEQAISLIYAFLYCTDAKEGLFTTLAGTLLDGDPTNNFLHRHLTFNPDGILNGAVNGTVAGNNLYVCCDAGLVVIDISKIGTELVEAALRLNPDGKKVLSLKELVKEAKPADPSLLKVLKVIPLKKPKAVRIQFRYAYVVDETGLKVIDVTDPASATLVEGAGVPFADAHNLYLARTHAYVAAGKDGLGIVNIEKAERPALEQMFTAEGHLSDVRDVKIGMTNASSFAYVANGHHGLAVVQLTSPETAQSYLGWASKLAPQLIATKHIPGISMAISEGLQRDRGVDESGNQLSVFNRVGSRPFNKQEMDRMYKIDGKLFTVSNDPPSEPLAIKGAGGSSAGKVDPAVTAKIAELEESIKKERNPAKKKTLQTELDELKKKAEEQSKAGGGPDPAVLAKIQELEESVKKERNPAKKKTLQAELDELKKKAEEQSKAGAAPAVDPEAIKALEEEVKKERNQAKKKAKQAELDELKKKAGL